MNRRVRNRTHGGVGGRGRRLPLLPDFIRQTVTFNIFHAKTRSLTSKNAKKEKVENSGNEQGEGRRPSLWLGSSIPATACATSRYRI